jgi:hypothetical protein
MRVLLKAVGDDTTEEALLSRSISELEAELQEAHQGTNNLPAPNDSGLDIDNEDRMIGLV